MIWKVGGRAIDLSRSGMVMGIINVTPDSFSDGGRHLDPEAALQKGLEMVEEGAAILDIGGESTRPGAAPVDEAEELRRVLPVLRALRKATGALLSIDTSKPGVAGRALAEGADIINDVGGLRDPAMARVAAEGGAGVVLMHMLGDPATMQVSPCYGDVVAEVGDFFRHSIERAVGCGCDPMQIVLDPGIGFGKTAEHNAALLRGIGNFTTIGRPLLVGASRKSFLGVLAGTGEMGDRFWPGVALTSLCRERGARIVRVHEVRPHVEALRMTEAILGDA